MKEGFLVPGSAVLDLGCGAGSNVLFLARSGFDSHGIDLSPEAVSSARERARDEHLSVDVRVGDALALPFPPARFAGAIDNGCFHTLPVRRRGDYASEVARVVRPGGSLVLSWIGREHTGARGPPHRPALEEVARALEPRFVFVRTESHVGATDRPPAVYDAWLRRRGSPQPPPR